MENESAKFQKNGFLAFQGQPHVEFCQTLL
jgi:hypothetical protein